MLTNEYNPAVVNADRKDRQVEKFLRTLQGIEPETSRVWRRTSLPTPTQNVLTHFMNFTIDPSSRQIHDVISQCHY